MEKGYGATLGGKWRNRIVERRDVDPEQLMAHPDNWRIHPKAQAGALKGILDEVGFVQDVIVNLRTDPSWGAERGTETLLDGHLRVSLALQNNEPTVPVVYVDLNPEEEKLILATFDPVGDLAVPDRDKLEEILVDVKVQDLEARKLVDKLSGESGMADVDDGPTDLPVVDIEGVSTERIRCIVVFDSSEELDDFYKRFGRQADSSKVLWRYADLAGSVVAAAEEDPFL